MGGAGRVWIDTPRAARRRRLCTSTVCPLDSPKGITRCLSDVLQPDPSLRWVIYLFGTIDSDLPQRLKL